MSWKIGVDGGGTKTECILVDPSGAVAFRKAGPGCSPSLVGPAQASAIVSEILNAVRAEHPQAEIGTTLLCMAGSRSFWTSVAQRLVGFGHASSTDDSVPVLELATRGSPGIVIHSGTGSFVAARSADGAVHYAGGIGWKFGDEGGGYDLGKRAVARALLELQGWAPQSAIGSLVCKHTGKSTADAVTAHYYSDPTSNSGVAGLAPEVLALASAGDPVAKDIVSGSVGQLLSLAVSVTDKLFGKRPADFRAGVSGSILNHPFVFSMLTAKAPFPLGQVTDAPIEGVRLLLARTGAASNSTP
jgi:glucosamine kinase